MGTPRNNENMSIEHLSLLKQRYWFYITPSNQGIWNYFERMLTFFQTKSIPLIGIQVIF